MNEAEKISRKYRGYIAGMAGAVIDIAETILEWKQENDCDNSSVTETVVAEAPFYSLIKTALAFQKSTPEAEAFISCADKMEKTSAFITGKYPDRKFPERDKSVSSVASIAATSIRMTVDEIIDIANNAELSKEINKIATMFIFVTALRGHCPDDDKELDDYIRHAQIVLNTKKRYLVIHEELFEG